MRKKMYRIGWSSGENPITEVWVVRETATGVWVEVLGTVVRYKRSSRGGRYFDEWTDAHRHLVEAGERALAAAISEVGYAKRELARLCALRQPRPPARRSE